ncbi:energy transducer TonB [Polyangium sp. 6x1]|uniref:energy transducer TonB n=1 Tax=Polyangium sp. 6x1 TaxID=3042689 RepID=UPI002482FFBE|nr:energy transducer TonB [Polyangium sp. 6x1]MDI1442641.1 energy transducer TonB [Polyangium sp. 6x1]
MEEGALHVGWLVAAAAAHVALFGAGYLRDESGAVLREMRMAIRAELDAFEVPIEPPPPPPEKPEPETPEPPPPQPAAMQAPRPLPKDPPDIPPKEAPPEEAPETPTPLPMEAPPVLVQEGLSDPLAVAFVTGNGNGAGLVSTFGTGFHPVRWPPGGVRTAAPPRPPPPEPDRSRSASLYGDRAWDCDFPPEADVAGVREAVVTLRILVRADGRAQKVEVVSDPGYGFGAQARYCAYEHRYRPALDRAGQPIQASLGPVRIRFTR